MSDAPAMPFFSDAYLGDTTHLTTEEHGAYFLILLAMWRRGGSIPNSDSDIARIVGLDLPKWRKTKRRLLPLLISEEGILSQKRLRKEWEYVQEKRNKNASNGSKGGRPKSNINNRLEKANGYEIDNPNESPHSHTHSHEKPNGFSPRESAKKPPGWFVQKTPDEAANELIKELDHDQRRNEERDQINGGAVLQLPAVRAG